MSQPNQQIFAAPLNVVPLGHIDPEDAAWNVTLDDLPTREPGAYQLDPEDADLLFSIDSTVTDREFTTAEQLRLIHLSELNVVALIPSDTDITTIELVPVRRYEMEMAAAYAEDGEEIPLDSNSTLAISYQILLKNTGETIELEPLQALILPSMDGIHSIGDIVNQRHHEILANPETREALAVAEAAYNETYQQHMFEAVMDLFQLMRTTKAGSVESPVGTPQRWHTQ